MQKVDIEDILNRGWVVTPTKKKDGTLSLCCDYEKLNSQEHPCWKPVANQYFRILDQEKVYHQL